MDWQIPFERGLIAYREGRTDDAVKDLESATRLFRSSPQCWFALGNAYARLGRHEEAIRAFQSCCALSPYESEPHSNMANSYMATGDYSSAVSEFEEALRIDPSDRVAKVNLPVARMLKEEQVKGPNVEQIRKKVEELTGEKVVGQPGVIANKEKASSDETTVSFVGPGIVWTVIETPEGLTVRKQEESRNVIWTTAQWDSTAISAGIQTINALVGIQDMGVSYESVKIEEDLDIHRTTFNSRVGKIIVHSRRIREGTEGIIEITEGRKLIRCIYRPEVGGIRRDDVTIVHELPF